MPTPEYKIQAALIVYLDLRYPRMLRIVAPGAGMAMNRGNAMKMKRMGYQKGTPDIVILEPSNGYHGLLIELKSEKGRLSKEQAEYLAKAKAKGYRCAVCFSYKEAVKIIDSYLIDALS